MLKIIEGHLRGSREPNYPDKIRGWVMGNVTKIVFVYGGFHFYLLADNFRLFSDTTNERAISGHLFRL